MTVAVGFNPPSSGCNPESTAEARGRRLDISIGTGSKIDDKSQRDFASKPRVARNELPWVRRGSEFNANGVAP